MDAEMLKIQNVLLATVLFIASFGDSFASSRDLDNLVRQSGYRFFGSGPKEIHFETDERPGTIIISASDRHLYLVQPGGRALRYNVGVAREGFEWSAILRVSAKREWPDWTPPAAMLQREPDIPHYMEGGLDNPLGARALYLGSTLYRIHGSNEPNTIGEAVSSGCIRMLNEDVMDLYDRVKIGAKVIVDP